MIKWQEGVVITPDQTKLPLQEVTTFAEHQTSQEGIGVMKTAFDITPLKCVSAIVCENIVYYNINFGEFRKPQV